MANRMLQRVPSPPALLNFPRLFTRSSGLVWIAGGIMFESLSERIHQDELKEESNGQRLTRYAVIALVAVGVIVALVQGAGLMR